MPTFYNKIADERKKYKENRYLLYESFKCHSSLAHNKAYSLDNQ